MQRVQEHLLPFMCDETHAPDTLFLVAEEDFRFYEQDSLPTDEIAARGAASAAASRTEPEARRRGAAPHPSVTHLEAANA